VQQAPADSDVSASQSAEEIAILKERFEEGVSVLKKKGKKSRNIYELPWYIIIGPPGSGKTTALINSGLEFPLAEKFGKEALRGVGGTRNCDWWFTDDAVLLDTAGRYVTQDSHADVDSSAWVGFLNLLKKYRKRRPINGAIIAVSLSDLMVLSQQERAQHVHAIKQRLQELDKHLGVRFPVYMLFTKCDLVAGFMEFFDDIGREERSQVWGMTFPVTKDDTSYQHFASEYDLLIDRLNNRLLHRLNQERDINRRCMIYSFPQQMASLKQTLDDFVSDVFKATTYDQPTFLRGVYFTSGTQEGTPVDRMMGSLARTFGLEQQLLPSYGSSGKSFFLTNLLKHVVFEEANLVSSNTRFEKQRNIMQWAAYVGSIALTVVAALAWTTSYTANESYVQEVDSSLTQYLETSAPEKTPSSNFNEILPRLNALLKTRNLSNVHGDDAPLHMTVGLYQGEALGVAAHDAYLRELNALLLPRIATRISEQLQASHSDQDLQYEVLKTYLMLGDTERLDPELIKLWMKLDWSNTYASEPEKLESLELHLATLLKAGIRPIALDQRLIQDARLSLTQVPLAELVYGRFKREYEAGDTSPFRVSDVIGRSGSRVFVRASGEPLNKGISGLFTYRGYHNVYQKQSKDLVNQVRKESWVLGIDKGKLGKIEMADLSEDFERLYLSDYIRTWEALIADIHVVPFQNVQHATEVLNIMSGPGSPMRSLLMAISRNTTLVRLEGAAGKIAENAAKKGQQMLARESRLVRLMQQTTAGTGAAEKVAIPGAAVDRRFAPLNRLVKAAQGSVPEMDNLIGMLSELYSHFSVISGAGALAAASQDAGSGDIIQRLRIKASRMPAPVKVWLQQVTVTSREVTLGSARTQLNKEWKALALPQCKRVIANRYPIYKDSTQEMTLKDFGQFFGPGGEMDGFFQKNLKSFVDTSRSPWKWKEGASKALGLSKHALLQFQRAALIKSTFFEDGGKKPSVNFALKALYLDAEISQFLLDIDEQKVSYRHDPQRVRNMQWPGPAGSSGVRVIFEHRNGERFTNSEDGPWAWFRILDKAQIEPINADRFVATFGAGGYQSKFEIRASSVTNPFLMKELTQFRCPGNL